MESTGLINLNCSDYCNYFQRACNSFGFCMYNMEKCVGNDLDVAVTLIIYDYDLCKGPTKFQLSAKHK